MANGKKSFVAYCDWKDTFEALPDEKAGQLVKHLFRYVNDENPNTEDVLINAVFANIKQTLKRDLKKYDEIKEKRSLAGKASADKRKKSQQVLTSVESVQQRLTNSTVSVNDSVSVSVNDINYNTIFSENDFSLLSEEQQYKLSKIKLDHILNDCGMWFERTAMNLNISKERFKKKFIEFGKDIQARKDYNKSIHDIQNHFVNWLKLNK